MKPWLTPLLFCTLVLPTSLPAAQEPAKPASQWLRMTPQERELQAEQGNAEAQFALAEPFLQRMQTDPTNQQEYAEKAAKWLKQAAERGHAEAQFELARLYNKGLGVEKNLGTGLTWLKTAAESGLTQAQIQLAAWYGGTGNMKERIRWLRRAAQKDDFHAILAQQDLADQLYGLGRIDEALEVYQQLSQRSHQRTAAYAMVKLARHYARQPGADAEKQAFDWYKQAADKDYEEAQYKTGMGFYTGKGTPADKLQAAEYFRRAANKGMAEAQYTLALLYKDGDGVTRDPVLATDWFRKAAKQGLTLAQLELCLMYVDSHGVEISPEETYGWCRKAAEQGEGFAQVVLGNMYESGSGVARDDTLAAEWYAKAAAQNIPVAADQLAAMKRRLASETASGKVREPKMIALPAGQYLMGSPTDENDRSWWEPKPRSVMVAAFELAEHEATFDEWDACVADGGCSHKPDDNGWGRGTRPVINVNLADIEQYLAWLNRKTGQRYRLPTDAEWEYAARAGTTTPFHAGACLSTEKANYKGYLAMKGCPEGQHREKTLPVKSFAANAWGFYDMHGNVAERTGECWLARDKPKAQPDCSIRAIRGGSWSYSEREARSGYLAPQLAELRYHTIGFRLAR